ncbi:urease accessory protein UreD [Dyadobacter pollutisoli]|uniref:Urease accessory protein UreD n=1 Tax=Dyadobacter pollutisoli TaxID=2910158 RepID=A0A9E8SS63_9BACT|nr:urease accessory protein UreD [Dyadobacter pollutisoli]WAC14987.1 urease accessory protein UreD [Dyadobacter pollutisoli]
MIASLHIQVASRGERAYLRKAYFSPPFKLADITENKNGKFLHVMQMSSSPGILDGDRYQVNVEVGDRCHLQLHTQSYQRLFKMKTGASQHMEVHVGKGASFIYLPHPCVPQEDSDFSAVNKIYLSTGSVLVWGEIITCGRKLNGEIFRFSRYHSRTEIFLDNRLIIKENLRLLPGSECMEGTGMLEGFTHQASLVYQAECKPADHLLAVASAFLATQEDIIFGITSGAGTSILLRILGFKSEQLFFCLKEISDILTETK